IDHDENHSLWMDSRNESHKVRYVSCAHFANSLSSSRFSSKQIAWNPEAFTGALVGVDDRFHTFKHHVCRLRVNDLTRLFRREFLRANASDQTREHLLA